MNKCDTPESMNSERIGTHSTPEEGRKWKEETQKGFRALCIIQRPSLNGPTAETFGTIINAVYRPSR